MLKVHILVNNIVRKRGFKAEHGLSLWIEKDNKKILFDTGQTSMFLHNAKEMDLDLTKTDYIILSHGHYDHCGGLLSYPTNGGKGIPNIYIHKEALLDKYAVSKKGDKYRYVGVPWSLEEIKKLKNKLIFNKKITRIENDITILGEIPSTTQIEEVPKQFFVKIDGKYTHDMILDEQMLIIEEDNKLNVFLGCSHPGVINALKYVKKMFPKKQISSLIAGMHLEDVSPIRLQMTIQHILDLNIEKVVPLHCTGFNATCELQRFLGDKCLICGVGDTIEIYNKY